MTDNSWTETAVLRHFTKPVLFYLLMVVLYHVVDFLFVRTMATWGSTPCHLDDVDDEDEYNLDTGAEEEEEQEESAESSSDEDVHIYSSSRNQCSYSNRKNQGRSGLPEAKGTLY